MANNTNNTRIFLASVIGVILWTTIYCFLPKNVLVNIGYSIGFLSLLILAVMIYLVASGSKARYITNVAFPLVAMNYVVLNLSFSIVVVFLAMAMNLVMPWKLFVVLHLVFISLFSWKILAMDAAQEAIVSTGERIREQCSNWKSLRVEADNIVVGSPAETQKSLRRMQEAIRNADPMMHPDIQKFDENVKEQLAVLQEALAKKDVEAVEKYCTQIQDTVKERGNYLKALKQ